MKHILKSIFCFAAVAALSVSCEEFEPVFTGKYPEPPAYEVANMEVTHTIAELKKMYVHSSDNKGMEIDEHVVIKGQVTSSDQSGNMYRSFYIQDETGGIEIKIGKTGLYNDYKLGQWVYVDCEGLTLGGYRGMINLGWKSTDTKYETSYIDSQLLIDRHISRGAFDDPVEPVEITSEDMMNANKDIYNKYYGMLVTIKGIIYADATFTLAYVDPDGNREDYQNNCLFLDESGGTWGVTTWAMSESKFMEYLNNGNFDDCEVAGTTVGEIRKGNYKPDGTNPVYIKSQACSVSQYFTFGGKTVQIRTSGYAKFADYEIDQRILDGVPVNLTGIFSIYTDKNWAMTDDRYDPEGLKTPQKQFTVIDLKDGVEIAD